MLYFDVNNGIARRAWARNEHAITAIARALEQNTEMRITLPNEVNGRLLDFE
jgi:urocanate hydratase